jgi:hypothetical protein
MDNNIIKVKRESHYGKTFIYPITHAKALEDLTGQKTLTEKSIKALKALGFSFELIQEPLSV